MEIDPQTGEEISVEHWFAMLSLEGIREEYLYVVEGSSDLKSWSELDRFYGESSKPFVVRLLEPFEAGFVRLKLTEKPPLPPGFASIPPATFTMGSPLGEPGRRTDETLHEVTLTNGFHLSETEVTWTEWTDVRDWAVTHGYGDLAIGSNGRNGDESGTHPVTEVSWWNAIKWCNARSEMDGRIPAYYTSANFGSGNILRAGTSTPFADWSANGYRLPTEAEWEYACRAGTSTAFYTGAITHTDLSPLDLNLDAAGWYGGNSESDTHAVGGKQANGWGLLDMHGNVREWCWDWYGAYGGDATDPKGERSGAVRVFRGGNWGGSARDCRSANRDGFTPAPATDNYGFRVALSSNP